MTLKVIILDNIFAYTNLSVRDQNHLADVSVRL